MWTGSQKLPALYERLAEKARQFADQEREHGMQRLVTRGLVPREMERPMDDEMNRQEFAEYMTGFERRLDGRFGRLDRRLDTVDGRLDGIDQRLDSMDRRFDAMDGRFDAMDGRLTEHDGRFGRIEAALGDLKQSMAVQFEETRREIKLSLEAVEALSDRMDRRFDEVRREHSDATAPLKDAVRHVARQIKPREPSGTKTARRRRS